MAWFRLYGHLYTTEELREGYRTITGLDNDKDFTDYEIYTYMKEALAERGKKMRAMVVECSDYDIVYGILTAEKVSAEEVQHKIYEIKNRFHDEGRDDWSIEEVFEEFPDEWNWEYESGVDIVEI